jgi:hypothetical protein
MRSRRACQVAREEGASNLELYARERWGAAPIATAERTSFTKTGAKGRELTSSSLPIYGAVAQIFCRRLEQISNGCTDS